MPRPLDPGGRGGQIGSSRGHNTVIATEIARNKPCAAVIACRFDQQIDARCANFLRH